MTLLPEPPPIPPTDPDAIQALLDRAASRNARPPSILPAILVGLLAMPFATVVVTLVVVVLAAASMLDSRGPIDATSMETLTGVPQVLFAMLVTQFLALGIVPIAAAYAGGGGTWATLGLVRARMRWWGYPFVVVGSFGVMMAAGLLTQLLVSGGLLPQMKEMPADMLMDMPAGWQLACLLVMSVGPGICEELVFRGYVMRRLALRWKPWQAIGLSSAFFGIAHIHPMHIFFAFLMGLWLGWLAWRTRSIVPSIIAHFAVDFTVFGAAVLSGTAGSPTDDPGAAEIGSSIVVSLVGLAAVAVVVRATRPDAAPAAAVLSPQ